MSAATQLPNPYEVVPVDDSTDWLKQRMAFVGASEAAAIMGASKYEDALSVYLRKRGLAPEKEETEPMRWGKLLEAPIAQEFAERTGRRVFGGGELMRSAIYPFMGCTLDREQSSVEHADPGVLEIKTAGPWMLDDWQEGLPVAYQIQVQHQLVVTGRRWGSVVALIGGQQLKWADVELHEPFAKALIAKLEQFWRCVERGTPPPASMTEAGRAALDRMFPQDSGETIALSADAIEWYDELEQIAVQEGELRKRKTAIQARVIEQLGEATYGALPHGRGRFSAKWIEKQPYTVKATRYREVRRLK